MKLSISTKGKNDIIDITEKVLNFVKNSKIREGMVLISCPGSTVGLTTIEADPNLLADFKEFLEKLVPSKKIIAMIKPGEKKMFFPILDHL